MIYIDAEGTVWSSFWGDDERRRFELACCIDDLKRSLLDAEIPE